MCSSVAYNVPSIADRWQLKYNNFKNITKMSKDKNNENKDLTATFGNTMLSAGFELKSRYSNDETSDRRGRWARLLYYKGNLISWINGIDHIDRGKFYSVSDFFPTQNNDNPLYHESTKEKDFEQIVKETELRFLSFLKSCRQR